MVSGPSIAIVDYDPNWPALFEAERGRILSATGHLVVVIEHVGSTAVPGLAAKPVIDIMAAVRHLDDARKCIEPLHAVGYEYVPEYEAELPERRYFHKGPSGDRTHHLHMVELTSDFWKRHLLFRDYLRAHPGTARQYQELKRRLAAQFGADRSGYTEAKGPFIRAVEEKARAINLV